MSVRSARLERILGFPLSVLAVLGGLAWAGAIAAPAAGAAGVADPVASALAGDALPVLVRVVPEAAGETVSFTLRLAPGEAPRGESIAVATAAGGEGGARVLERHPDGSAARVGVHFEIPPATTQSRGGAEVLVLVRPPRVADPAGLEPAAASGEGPGRGRPGVTVFGGAVASVVEAGLWHGDLAAEGASTPPWWDDAAARFPMGSDPEDLDGRIEFVQVAYAEKGRAKRAIKLFREIAADALPDGPEGASSAAEASPARVRSWLRACHEIAHLYEGGLQDDVRGLGWSLRCAEAPLTDPAEERQNRIAAGLGALRALEGLGHRREAVTLYRALARNLLLDPDPYGTLLLPQIFLRIGDAELELGEDGGRARDEAERAYRAAMAAAERLPETVPSNYLAPGSAARASLRRLEARGLALSRIPDGTYEGEAFGYNAPVEVRMSFDGGRCTALHVIDLGDKRPLDAYRVLPDRILESQSLEVDAVTGATVTSRAIVSAATEAVFTAGQGRGDDGGTPGGD